MPLWKPNESCCQVRIMVEIVVTFQRIKSTMRYSSTARRFHLVVDKPIPPPLTMTLS